MAQRKSSRESYLWGITGSFLSTGVR